VVALGFGIVGFRRFWWGRLLGWAGVNERVRDWIQLHLQSVRTVELEQERQRDAKPVALEKAPPQLPAENEKVDSYLEGPVATTDKIRGWVLMDYVDTPGDLLHLLVECNYH